MNSYASDLARLVDDFGLLWQIDPDPEGGYRAIVRGSWRRPILAREATVQTSQPYLERSRLPARSSKPASHQDAD